MAQAEKIAKTPGKTVSTLKYRDSLMLEFKKKFGHAYDPGGYRGHPFFGSHCYGCGIHISRIVGKNLQDQLELDTEKAQSGFSRRMENTGTEVINILHGN